MNRRRFLEAASSGLAAMVAATVDAAGIRPNSAITTREIAADLVVIGGGLGGCAAALAAVESGLTVVLTEPTDWIGGQLTAQAVPPDEHPWIEQFGSNARYRDLREGIRDYYRKHYPLTAAARADRLLNPGGGGVSRLCHEPRVALAVLTAMMAPFASGGKLLVLLEHEPIRAEVHGDRVRAVVVRDRRSGDERTLLAPYFADATELGDVLPLAGVEFVTGAESRAETGEPHAPETARPDDQQGITACFAMEYLDGQDHTIDRPGEYGFWRDFAPKLTPPWPGKLLAPHYTHPINLKPVDQGFDPRGRGAGLWNYRRIADPRHFEPGTFPGRSGITLVNWPQNDCWLGPLVGPGITPAQAETTIARAKQLSLSLLYWLQTEAPRADGKAGWPGLRLRPDIVGTADGLAKAPYVRESRRVRAEFTVVEQHVGTEARRKAVGRDDASAENFPDSVGVGSYRIDLHPGTGGTNYIDISSLPFQIPLGALIPRRIENLLPACKNIGTTHITNGCYRLHPVEWAIGEAVGTLAAHCLGSKLTPRGVRKSQDALTAFQRRLVTRGVELAWPSLTPR